jgi:hypothetical protein
LYQPSWHVGKAVDDLTARTPPGSLGSDDDFGLDLLVENPSGIQVAQGAFVGSASNALALSPNNGLAELDVK